MKRWILSCSLTFPLLLLLLLPGGLAAQQSDQAPDLGERTYHDPGGPDGGNGGGGAGCAGDNVVYARDSFFEPETITIQVGETVTWCHDGSLNHNVVEGEPGNSSPTFRCADGCDGSGGDGDPSRGWSFSIRFTDARTVDYFCELHFGIGMTGRVIVEGDDGGGGGDSPGSLAFRAGAYGVDESGGGVLVHVERSGGDDGAVGVDVTSSNGSATAGQDYTAVSRTLSWADGDDSTKTFNIPVQNDTDVEGDETFEVNLSSPTGGASLGSPRRSTVTIRDDDEEQLPGTLAFSSFAFGASEGGDAALTVRRTGGASGEVTVDYQTTAGSAAAGEDFESRSGTLTFGDGETEKAIGVPISTDGSSEPVESFSTTLSSPGGGASLGSIQTASVLVFDTGESQATLTGDEVLCDGFRLAGLLDRISLMAPNTDKPLGVNLTFSRSGDFAGLAYTGNGPGTAEHHLAFSTNPEETTLLRNPERPQLDAVSLTRNLTNSDLVSQTAADALTLQLNPTLQDDPPELILLNVNDYGDPVTREGGTPAESKPGRGLSSLVERCHEKLTARDQHVFQVLAKVARASTDGAASTEIAVFRGEGTDTYRIDVYPVAQDGSSMGRLAAELEIDFGPGDRLDGGTLRLLGPCDAGTSAGCTSVQAPTELQLVEPRFTGEFWNVSPYAVSTAGASESTVDFADLLADTSWRRPL